MKQLDRLLEIERDIERNLSRGSIDAVEFHREERLKIISEIQNEHNTVDRLNETINWIDSQLGYLSANDKTKYIDFEWLKSHLLSIKDNENRSFLKDKI